MARPIWSGSISFGLVTVPVKLFSATSPKEVRFHMLHDKDGGRIQQKRVCSIDGEEVSWEHIVKGFEISKGRYVTVTREELEAFNPKATRRSRSRTSSSCPRSIRSTTRARTTWCRIAAPPSPTRSCAKP